MYALESAQRAQRRSRYIREAEVKLHNFVTFALTRIGDRHFRRKRIASLDCFRKTQSTIRKRRVTQAIAKRVQRLAFEIAISAALHRVVLKRWQLLDSGIESHWKPASGIVLARQRLRDGCSALFARIPGLHDGVHMFVRPVESKGAAVREHKYDRFSQCSCRFQQ